MTTPSVLDGAPGLEGLWTLTPPSTPIAFPAVALNNWMDPTTGVTVYPYNYLQLTDIQGLKSKADADDPRAKLNYQIGEYAFPRLPRGKTLVFSGRVVGASLAEMRRLCSLLDAACNSGLNVPGNAIGANNWRLSGGYDTVYSGDETLVAYSYGVPIDLQIVEKQGSGDLVPTPYQRTFDLTWRASDPRWWFPGQSIANGDDGTPIADGVTNAMTMTGTAPSEPIFRIIGSGAGSNTIILTHDDLTLQIEIQMPAALGAGDVLQVDFTTRLITFFPADSSPEIDYSGYIDWPNTDWWNETSFTMVPGGDAGGTNTFTVSGDPWWVQAAPASW